MPTPPTKLRATTETQTAARQALEYNLGMIGWVLIATANGAQIWTCPVTNCPFTTAVEHNPGMKDDDEREKEETLVRAHNHSHTVHDKLFTQAIGGGQWRTLPATVQNSLITRSIATWNKNLKKQRQKITVERFSFQPKDDEAPRVWMHGLFAEENIPKGTRFTGSYTGEAISRAQMITRTAISDKLMKINGMFVDGTDPRFASYLSMANTCPPAGHPNTEAFALDGGKEVCFNTTRMMAKGEQILWKCHEIFDEPNKLVDFADPESCDLQIERQEEARTPSQTPSNRKHHPALQGTALADPAQTTRVTSAAVAFRATLWGCDQYDCDFDLRSSRKGCERGAVGRG